MRKLAHPLTSTFAVHSWNFVSFLWFSSTIIGKCFIDVNVTLELVLAIRETELLNLHMFSTYCVIYLYYSVVLIDKELLLCHFAYRTCTQRIVFVTVLLLLIILWSHNEFNIYMAILHIESQSCCSWLLFFLFFIFCEGLFSRNLAIAEFRENKTISQKGEITLSITDVGKSCPYREF